MRDLYNPDQSDERNGSENMASNQVKHVVVDAGGFIKNAPINDIGSKIYSLKDVVAEIRDRSTRQRLQVLPYEIIFKQPPPDAIKFVTEFSKKTGDYKSLSAVDIKVMALTFQLEKENVGTDHIKNVPDKKADFASTNARIEKNTEIAGFYVGSQHHKSLRNSQSESSQCSTEMKNEDIEKRQEIKMNVDEENVPEDLLTDSLRTDHCEDVAVDSKECNNNYCENHAMSTPNDQGYKEGDILPTNAIQDEEVCDDDNDDEDDSGDDGEGWITPSNIKQIQSDMDSNQRVTSEIQVACLTTDFAIQNVLIQMGLNVVSVDGFLIKKAKSYVLRCHACMRITTKMDKTFCPQCGNKTLQKISMTVEEDGQIKYCISNRRAMNVRGLKHSLPTPKGGKHANNPLLVEDQRMPQQRLSKKAQQRMDVFDPDYIAGSSPFKVNDINSRAAQIGVKGGKYSSGGRKNPNENKKIYGRRK